MSTTSNIPGWLTVRQAREILGVSRQRVHQIVAAKRIPTLEISPRLILISQAEIESERKKREKSPDGC